MLYCQSKPDAGDRVKPAYAGTPRELAVMEATGKQEAVEAATRTGGGINAGAIGNGGQDGGGAGLNPGVANAIKHKGLKDAGFSPDYLEQQAAALKRISNGALQRGGVLWNPLPPLIQRWVDRDMKILQEPHARLKIGITLAIEPGEQSVFVNGAKQASFFLFETLAPRHEVVLINLDFRGNVSSASEDFNSEAIDGSVVTFEEALKMDLHVVIEEGSATTPNAPCSPPPANQCPPLAKAASARTNPSPGPSPDPASSSLTRLRWQVQELCAAARGARGA